MYIVGIDVSVTEIIGLSENCKIIIWLLECTCSNVRRNIYIYECCIQDKMTRISFPQISYSYTYQPIQLVHSVLCGPMRTISPGGKKYFLTFINFNKYTVTYLLTKEWSTRKTMVANLEEKCKSYKLSGEVENIWINKRKYFWKEKVLNM